MGTELGALFYSLSASLSWGAADFSGGIATRNNSVYSVVIISQIIGFVLLAVLSVLFHETLSSVSTILWGILGGCAGSLGIAALYQGLATGRMSVVAPLAALVSGVLPVIVGMALEGLPTRLQLIGFALALVAVWLTSSNHDGTRIQLKELLLPSAAGMGFGMFFVAIDQMSTDAIFLPLVVARLASISLLIFIAVVVRRKRLERPTMHQLPLVAVAGLLDTAGNMFFAFATVAGRLDIASVLGSLYPAVTVLLAWFILKESINRQQWIGVSAALVAVILIAA